MSALRNKEYLGDAVYVQHDGFGMLTLTTENGVGATNAIHLEPQVFAALCEYVKRQLAIAKAEGKP